eukprot:4011615-Pyramimonas_sp.AAC.1
MSQRCLYDCVNALFFSFLGIRDHPGGPQIGRACRAAQQGPWMARRGPHDGPRWPQDALRKKSKL